jgi:putative ABC transport system substrate-binding protein
LPEKIELVHASSDGDLDPVFATLGRLLAGGLVIAPDQVLFALSEQIAALAIRHRVPTSFQYRQAAAAGGSMSYGANAVDLFRLAGRLYGPSPQRGEARRSARLVLRALKITTTISGTSCT